MPVTPEQVTVQPPCLVKPTVDCHLPCLNFGVCKGIFAEAIERFGNSPARQREIAKLEGEIPENRRLLLNALRETGILQKCIGLKADPR